MIKFRVWNTIHKEYNNDGFLYERRPDGLKFYAKENCILEQSTGLKDKSGVEIFVGDIVMLGDKKTTVKYDVLIASFVLDSGNITYKLTKDKKTRLEVIGNIHDNKELLEYDQVRN